MSHLSNTCNNEDLEVDEAVQGSLREIASLLLMVHDFYFSQLENPEDILINLVSFTEDINISNKISVLDIERMRRKVMGNSGIMGYEEFYDWLRLVSILIYPGKDINGRKGLHYVLTNNIIPAASRWEEITGASLERSERSPIRLLTNQALRIFVTFSDFFHFWYYDIVSKGSCPNMALSDTLWSQVNKVDGKGRASSDLMKDSLIEMEIIPDYFSEKDIETVMSLSSEVEDKQFDLPWFLYFVELLSERIDIEKFDYLNFERAQESKLLLLIKIILERKFQRKTVEIYCALMDLREEIQQQGLSGEREAKLIMTLWLRQAGIFQLFAFDQLLSFDSSYTMMRQIQNLIESEAEIPDSVWDSLANSIVSNAFKHLEKEIPNVENPLDALIPESFGKSLFVLAFSFPSLFFCTAAGFPKDIRTIYNELFDSTTDDRDKISSATSLLMTKVTSSNWGYSLKLFNNISQEGFPSVLSALDLQVMIVLTKALSDESLLANHYQSIVDDVCWASLDLGPLLASFNVVELVFLLVLKSSPRPSELLGEVIATLQRLQRTTPHITSNSSSTDPIVTSLEVVEETPNAVSNTIAHTANENESFSMDYESTREVMRPEEGDANVQKQPDNSSNYTSSISDVLKLLMHFPISGYTVSPWDVYDMYRDVTDNLNEKQPTEDKIYPTLSGSNGSNHILSQLLAAFSQQYDVTLPELTKFFLTYYVGPESPVKLKKVSSFNSLFWDYFANENVMRLLSLNADLLRWEFGRCYSEFHVPKDPFTLGLVPPTLANGLVEAFTIDSIVLRSNAISWLLSYLPSFASERAEELFAMTSYFSGDFFEGKGTSNTLTFSSFVIFAAYGFTDSLLLGQSADPDLSFLQEIRHMLQTFSQNLSKVQRDLEMRVLQPLFDDLSMGDDNSQQVASVNAEAALKCSSSSVRIFNYRLKSILSSSLKHSKQEKLAPRPPLILWDAPRFIEYCKYFGLLGHHGAQGSIAIAWAAFGALLYKRIPAVAGEVIRQGAVPALPIPINAENIEAALHEIPNSLDEYQRLRGSDLSAVSNYELLRGIHVRVLLPSLVARSESRLATPSDEPTTNTPLRSPAGIALEDILRYGGSSLVRYLADSQGFLNMSFYFLQEQARSSAIEQPFLFTHPDCRLRISPDLSSLEVPLNIACSFVACKGLLSPSEVATHAREALHNRLRPIYALTNAASTEAIVALNFIEFEELFVRSAFHLWHVGDLSDRVDVGRDRDRDRDNSLVMSKYLEERKLAASQKKRDAFWGCNFLQPFISVMQSLVVFPTNLIAECRNSGKLDSPSLSNLVTSVCNRGTESQRRRAPRERSDGQRQKPRQPSTADDVSDRDKGIADALETVTSKNFMHAISDPVARRVLDDVFSKQSASRRQQAAAAAASSMGREQVEDRNRSWSSFSEDQGEAEVRQESLITQAKEALWPVFATYCSCGDSLDPGKLSGPNLFTLLSKLGVLNDRTLLSDVGRILYQVASRSFQKMTSAPSFQTLSQQMRKNLVDVGSLTFEEFLIFLYAFAQLRYESKYDLYNESECEAQEQLLKQQQQQQQLSSGILSPTKKPPRKKDFAGDRNSGANNSLARWQSWHSKMLSSSAFQRLLKECVLPIIQRQTLLAFPEDARLRDKFKYVFSFPVLSAIESVEGPLHAIFQKELKKLRVSGNVGSGGVEISAIMVALKRINLIPKIMNEAQVLQLVRDVLPEAYSKQIARMQGSSNASVASVASVEISDRLLFPQWEWVLCIVAFQAVDLAVRQSDFQEDAEEKIPDLVASVIFSITAAITN